MAGFRASVVGLALVAAAGCSQSPLPISRPFAAGQEALTGAAHWQILAEDTAKQIVGCLEGRLVWNRESQSNEPVCRYEVAGLKGRPLHVERADSAMPFGRAFHDYLTTELVKRGRTVAVGEEGAIAVRYRVQFLKRDGRVPVDSIPGTWALVGGGIWAVQNVTLARMAGLGALTDVYVSANDYGGSQVVITTSLMDGERFVMRRTDAYFINALDVGQYVGAGPAADLVPPRKAGAPAPAVRTFSVVAE